MGRKVANVIFVVVIAIMLGFTFYGDHIKYKILNYQADKLYKQGRYYESLLKSQEALKLGEKVAKPDSPELLTSLGNVTCAYRQLEKRQNALSTEKRILNILQKSPGKNGWKITQSFYRLADDDFSLKNYGGAVVFCDSALTILISSKSVIKKVNIFTYLDMYQGILFLRMSAEIEKDKLERKDKVRQNMTISPKAKLIQDLKWPISQWAGCLAYSF